MPIVAEVVDVVVGGDTHRDTHRDTHALEMITPVGVTVARIQITNDEAGYGQALVFIAEHADRLAVATGRAAGTARVVVALEGTRSYGVGLARALSTAGMTVVESEQPSRAQRRKRGKTDGMDAHYAAINALSLDTAALPVPRADGDREALRILLVARHEQSVTRTRQTNQLHALLLAGRTDAERQLARGRFTTAKLATIARRRARPAETREEAVRRTEARRLAQTITTADQELAQNKKTLEAIVTDMAPSLLAKKGVGPVSAAQAIVSWSHPGRCRNDAAYAALAGVSPIPASSGQTQAHRLNRGGDRALNRALHAIVLTRWRYCEHTHAYIQRRRAEGKTDKHIRRSLKRYVARELYKTLNTELAA